MWIKESLETIQYAIDHNIYKYTKALEDRKRELLKLLDSKDKEEWKMKY